MIEDRSKTPFTAAEKTALVRRGAGALLVGAGPFFNSKRERLVALAARHNRRTHGSPSFYRVALGRIRLGFLNEEKK